MQQQGSVPHLAPWRALVLYVALGALWFSAVDAVLPLWVEDAARVRSLQRYAVYLFVLLAGVLVAWQIRAMVRAEAARAAAMQEFFHIVRHAPVGIARVDSLTGRIEWANARLARMVGLPLEQLCEHRFDELVPAGDVQLAHMQLQQLQQGEVDHVQSRRQFTSLSDGKTYTALCTVAMVHGDAESAVLVHVLQDLTEMEAARQAVEHQARLLRLALDGSGSGMWDWDVKERSYTFSDGMAAMLRYEGTGLPHNVRFKHMLHPDDRVAVRAAVERALYTGCALEVTARVRCYDGIYRWFQAKGMRHMDSQGQVVRFSGILTDQTAQRQEQERQRLAATVVDNTMEGVVVTDAKSRILSINPAFTRLLGYEEHELVGETPRVFKSGKHGPSFYQSMWKSMAETGHWRGEIWNRRKNGEVFPERMSLSAVYDGSGTVTHYVCMFTDISEEKRNTEQLEFLAHKDPLTGLSNRSWFGQELQQAVEQARGEGERMAVLLLNIDRFKDLNDSYGHRVGDEVLKHIASQVQSALRPGDMIGRMAGDEITVVARNLQADRDAEDIAHRLIQAAARPWKSPDGFEVVVSTGVGICIFPEHAQDAAGLLQGAHAAMHGAKVGKGQGNPWCIFDENMTAEARERIALEAKLREAVEQQQLKLYYQPQVDLATGRIVGVEALLRWIDPQDGFISPARFIPVAESSGLIGPLGEWVIYDACRQARDWKMQGIHDISVAVNVSQHQFMLMDIADCTQRALNAAGIPAHMLELEITESALADRPDEALGVLRRLKDLGVRLAIDDFGTGYSSLAHLKRYPIDVLKIDQGFVRDIPHSQDDMAICNAIIAMGRSLEMQVLAEGVETAAQLEFLRENGCSFYQGYFCSKPLPPEELAPLLLRQMGPISSGGTMATAPGNTPVCM